MTTVDHAARAEDLTWLADTGENLTGAAQRLGTTPDALEKWCRAHDLYAVYLTLRHREPVAPSASDRGRAGAAARWAS